MASSAFLVAAHSAQIGIPSRSDLQLPKYCAMAHSTHSTSHLHHASCQVHNTPRPTTLDGSHGKISGRGWITLAQKCCSWGGCSTAEGEGQGLRRPCATSQR